MPKPQRSKYSRLMRMNKKNPKLPKVRWHRLQSLEDEEPCDVPSFSKLRSFESQNGENIPSTSHVTSGVKSCGSATKEIGNTKDYFIDPRQLQQLEYHWSPSLPMRHRKIIYEIPTKENEPPGRKSPIVVLEELNFFDGSITIKSSLNPSADN